MWGSQVKPVRSNNASNGLAEFNALKAEARKLGVDPKGMKKVDLQTAIDAANLDRWAERERKAADKAAGDPFDEIDPEVEGDHLVPVMTPEQAEEEEITTANREGWLNRAVRVLEPMLAQVGAVVDPNMIAVSVGFGPRSRALGTCFPQHASDNPVSQLFISPVESDAVKILATLTHELIHASDDCASGHQGHFAKCARAVGLEGKLTATHAGDSLAESLKDVAAQLGEYPHHKLNLSQIKKQKTMNLKMVCDNCDYIMRTTQKWLDTYETFPCPCSDLTDLSNPVIHLMHLDESGADGRKKKKADA